MSHGDSIECAVPGSKRASDARGGRCRGQALMACVYQAASPGEAQLRVAIVGRGEADLLVRRVGSRGLARGEARWFITRDRQDAGLWIHFTSIGMAELKVCFVDADGEAGWVRPHRLQGRLITT
ncbi:DUF6150 family protein [Chitiniphilus purpureus]|uniref:DUF6150 family protein n=1 Tax=Chitiniphilus purpureus TaxID=2981137 RepID=A0ABY6DSA7_9NEIS|nr:DUF6150 family protein [Chitiniphilus sp. CD1]UXY17259.1 DUF6150 family protein [Chitiniphilus sp. CD1]